MNKYESYTTIRIGTMCKHLASLFLLLLCLCSLISPPRTTAQGQVMSVRVGVVARVEGEVQVRWHGIGVPELLKPGDGLSKGDLLLTSDTGRVELTLTYDSYLLVAPLSRVWMYEVGNERIHLDILRGEVSAIVKRTKDGTPLVLDTPPVELDIVKRGHYVLQVAADGSTEAYVEAGELRFVGAKGETVRLKKHKRVRFAAPACCGRPTRSPDRLRA
jgi:hypothetical protein